MNRYWLEPGFSTKQIFETKYGMKVKMPADIDTAHYGCKTGQCLFCHREKVLKFDIKEKEEHNKRQKYSVHFD